MPGMQGCPFVSGVVMNPTLPAEPLTDRLATPKDVIDLARRLAQRGGGRRGTYVKKLDAAKATGQVPRPLADLIAAELNVDPAKLWGPAYTCAPPRKAAPRRRTVAQSTEPQTGGSKRTGVPRYRAKKPTEVLGLGRATARLPDGITKQSVLSRIAAQTFPPADFIVEGSGERLWLPTTIDAYVAVLPQLTGGPRTGKRLGVKYPPVTPTTVLGLKQATAALPERISEQAVTYRIQYRTFPPPDLVEEVTGRRFWLAKTIDRYVRTLERIRKEQGDG